MGATMALTAAAQDLRTSYFMETSVNRHEMNPALLSESYVNIPLVLGNFNLGTTSNFGLKTFVYKMQPTWQGYGVDNRNLTTFMHPDVSASEFLGGLNDKSRLALNLKYQLVGVGFKAFGGVNSVELNLRSNTGISLPKSLFEFMKTAGEKNDYQIDELGIRSESFLELALGHSHKINDQITVGAKAKFLFGAAYADLDAKKLNLHLSDDYWNIDGDIQMQASLMNSTLEYEDPSKNDANGRRRISGIDEFKPSLSGFGMAFDLGATYQVMPDLMVSAAITDLGFISWSNTYMASSAGNWTFDGFKNPIYAGGEDTGNNKLDDQLDALIDDLEDIFSVYEDGKESQSHALAATINLGAEYTLPVYRNLRFGFLYTSRMAGKFAHHQAQLSAVVRPVKWFEAAWNMAGGTAGFTSGLVLDFRAKHFNFFIGTDRFFGKVSKQFIPLNKANTSVSLGLSVPLGK